MDIRQAFKHLQKGPLHGVYVCYGSESYLIREFMAQLQAACVEPGQAEFAVSKYDLKETAVQDVIEDAETLPFMVPTKIILAEEALFLTGAKDTSKVEHDLDRLLAYLESPVEFTVLVLVVHADKLDERKKIVKNIKDKGAVISFQPLNERDLKQWMQNRAKQSQCELTEEAIDRLLQHCGPRLQTLATEIDKLSTYGGERGVIRDTHVMELVPRSSEENIFQLIERIVEQKVEAALKLYDNLLNQKEEPIKILALMARQYRMMLQVKHLRKSGYSDQQIGSQIGAHPYAAKRAGEQAKRYSDAKLGHMLEEIARLDFEMKTGRANKTRALELLIIQISSQTQRESASSSSSSF
ncbi:DNA polymerase III subunit delta [Marinicrinis sediminis]|uniref:DNA polymerase III subunit delta n=1 Tax=Marinicrinis sediminis TaxID=1652465 RepID=A0ABW5RB05_9BACL